MPGCVARRWPGRMRGPVTGWPSPPTWASPTRSTVRWPTSPAPTPTRTRRTTRHSVRLSNRAGSKHRPGCNQRSLSGIDSMAPRPVVRCMPKYGAELDRVFHALGDASRRGMVERLSRGPSSVSELAQPFDMALPTIVQHLGVLEAAGIVTSTKSGRVRTYQLAVDALTPARAWMDEQRLPAERRLDRLGSLLQTKETE